MEVTRQKLANCREALPTWSSTKFEAISITLKPLTKRLEDLQKYEQSENLDNIKRFEKEIHRLMEIDVLRWKQRSKRHWYKHRDRNTKYFHAWANQRRQKKSN